MVLTHYAVVEHLRMALGREPTEGEVASLLAEYERHAAAELALAEAEAKAEEAKADLNRAEEEFDARKAEFERAEAEPLVEADRQAEQEAQAAPAAEEEKAKLAAAEFAAARAEIEMDIAQEDLVKAELQQKEAQTKAEEAKETAVRAEMAFKEELAIVEGQAKAEVAAKEAHEDAAVNAEPLKLEADKAVTAAKTPGSETTNYGYVLQASSVETAIAVPATEPTFLTVLLDGPAYDFVPLDGNAVATAISFDAGDDVTFTEMTAENEEVNEKQAHAVLGVIEGAEDRKVLENQIAETNAETVHPDHDTFVSATPMPEGTPLLAVALLAGAVYTRLGPNEETPTTMVETATVDPDTVQLPPDPAATARAEELKTTIEAATKSAAEMEMSGAVSHEVAETVASLRNAYALNAIVDISAYPSLDPEMDAQIAPYHERIQAEYVAVSQGVADGTVPGTLEQAFRDSAVDMAMADFATEYRCASLEEIQAAALDYGVANDTSTEMTTNSATTTAKASDIDIGLTESSSYTSREAETRDEVDIMEAWEAAAISANTSVDSSVGIGGSPGMV